MNANPDLGQCLRLKNLYQNICLINKIYTKRKFLPWNIGSLHFLNNHDRKRAPTSYVFEDCKCSILIALNFFSMEPTSIAAEHEVPT